MLSPTLVCVWASVLRDGLSAGEDGSNDMSICTPDPHPHPHTHTETNRQTDTKSVQPRMSCNVHRRDIVSSMHVDRREGGEGGGKLPAPGR